MKMIPYGGTVAVVPGFFDIVHARNRGAAFGMMAAIDSSVRIPFFYGVAAFAIVVIALMLWRMRDDERLLPVSFALIFGGIAGNIVDRLRFGAVVDFLSFHWQDAVLKAHFMGWHLTLPLDWPAFNIADSAITISMVLLIISAFRRPKAEKL